MIERSSGGSAHGGGGPISWPLPFVRNEDGELVAGEAQERQSAGAAESAARRMMETSARARWRSSRTGDPQSGEFADAVVLREFGEVPSLDELLRSG